MIKIRNALRSLALVSLLAVAFAQTDLASLEQAVKTTPNSVEAWINLGNAYFAMGAFDKAAESFYEAIALDYLSGDAHFGLGLSEYERGDFAAALFEFGEVARLYPDRFDGHFNRAVTLAKLRRFDESAQAFRRAIEEAEPEASLEQKVNAYLGLAGQLKRIEDFSGAAEAYSAALELRPDDAELAYQQAESLYFAGKGLEALPGLTELESRSSDYRVSALIADIYVQEEQIDSALRALERALRKAAGTADAQAEASLLLKLGLLQRDLGRPLEALASFQRAAAANPNNWQVQYHLGVSYLEDKQAASAQLALQQALNLNAESAETHLALASTYEQLRQFDAALGTAEAALERFNGGAEAQQLYGIIGRSLYFLGNYSAAVRAFDNALQIRADDALAQLWAGLAEYQLENYLQAVQYLERAVQLDPMSVEARANLGAAYFQSERYRDAELVYQLILEDNPQDAEAFYHLGLSLLAQNRRDAAQEAWQQSVSLGYGPAQDALQRYF